MKHKQKSRETKKPSNSWAFIGEKKTSKKLQQVWVCEQKMPQRRTASLYTAQSPVFNRKACRRAHDGRFLGTSENGKNKRLSGAEPKNWRQWNRKRRRSSAGGGPEKLKAPTRRGETQSQESPGSPWNKAP